MTPYFLIIILAVAVLFWIGFSHVRKQAKKHSVSPAEEAVGICSVAFERRSRKETKKKEILALLKEKGQLDNSDIRKMLGLSARSVVRYLDELEQKSKVEQVGRTGQSVIYRLK